MMIFYFFQNKNLNYLFIWFFISIKVSLDNTQIEILKKPKIAKIIIINFLLGNAFSIGKKSIPFEVLQKEGELSPEDFQVMRKIPSATKKILNDILAELEKEWDSSEKEAA